MQPQTLDFFFPAIRACDHLDVDGSDIRMPVRRKKKRHEYAADDL